MNSTVELLSPPEVAKRWRVNPEKVNKLIRSGELRAINIATRPNGRPRYRVYMKDVIEFEKQRSNVK